MSKIVKPRTYIDREKWVKLHKNTQDSLSKNCFVSISMIAITPEKLGAKDVIEKAYFIGNMTVDPIDDNDLYGDAEILCK